MNDFGEALYTAANLIGHFDAELRQIVFLSLGVSLTASICAFALGAPLGTRLERYATSCRRFCSSAAFGCC